jgi:hypothetical protein
MRFLLSPGLLLLLEPLSVAVILLLLLARAEVGIEFLRKTFQFSSNILGSSQGPLKRSKVFLFQI